MTCGRKIGDFDCCSVVEGDTLHLIQSLPDNFLELTITSPPYNLGNNHHTGNVRKQAYIDDIPESQYQEGQQNMLTEIYRATSINGSLFYNHKNRIKKGKMLTPYTWLLETAWVLKQELVWFNGSQNFDKCRFYPMTERVYWLAKSTQTRIYNAINHHDLFSRVDWPPVKTKGGHVRAFPEELVSDILSCLPAAQIIFDPYCGSGTTCVVAKRLGRHFLGIDIEPKYCEIARQRLAEI